MADDKDLRDGRDRSRVSGSEEYELQHLAEKLNVSTEEVRRAIEQVGNSREKLEEFLRRNQRNA
jgi:signal transduction histidine kinase